MTTTITGAELRGYHPGNESDYRSEADYIVPGDDLNGVDITSRAADYKDSGKINIDNQGGEWSGTVRHGDRVEFFLGETKDGEGYGVGGYGVGSYGSSQVLRWTGLVRPYQIDGQGADLYDLKITAEDFAASVMGSRRVYATFEDRKIVGSNGLVNEVIKENAPELDTSDLPDLSATTSMFIHGDYLLDVVAESARRCNCVLSTSDEFVRFTQPSDVSPKFSVETSDVGTWSFKSNDDNIVNEIRVEGGTGRDIEEQAQQTTVDGYTTVTDSSRSTYQINTRKSAIDRVEIWTRPTGSEEDITVRLQKDDGGSPINPGSNKSDIAKKTLSHEFLAEDDWTTFIFPEHTLPEPFPWLLIESEGGSGQDIGINTSTDEPGVIPYYPYDVIIQTTSTDSVDQFRRREDKITDDTLGSFAAARDAGNSHLTHNDQPTETLTVDAQSERMHGLRPADVVHVEREMLDVNGDFVVTEVGDNYSGTLLKTSLTLQDIDSL